MIKSLSQKPRDYYYIFWSLKNKSKYQYYLNEIIAGGQRPTNAIMSFNTGRKVDSSNPIDS